MVKYCSYGLCKSDSSKEPNLKWAWFPQPKSHMTAAKLWVQLIGRSHFTVKDITRFTYICERHFDPDVLLNIKENPGLRPFPYKQPQFQQFPTILSHKRKRRKLSIDDAKPGNTENKENIPAACGNPEKNQHSAAGCGNPENDEHSAAGCGNTGIKENDTNDEADFSMHYINRDVNDAANNDRVIHQSASPSFKVKRAITNSTYKRPVQVRRNISLTFPMPQKTPEKINQPKQDKTPRKSPVSVGCQVNVPTKGIVKRLEGRNSLLEKKLKAANSLSSFILGSNSKAKYYTGITKVQREALWNFLGEAKYHLRIINTKKTTSTSLRKLTVEDQFLLTLFKLRCNYTFKDIGFRHAVNPRMLSNIFKSWLQLLFVKFKSIEDRMFTLYDDLPKPLPKAFNNSLLKYTRVVIDCSELFIESTSDFEAQGNIFSSYKHHTTAKVLIGVAPSGGVVFASNCFEGSISDREIVIQSGFLDKINPNDLVLADRGFTIEDLLAEKGARLNIPPFLSGRPNFTLGETRKTKIIARARIHVERFNQRFKRFRFLKGIIPQCHLDVLTQAVYVCSCLCNFDKPLVR